MPEVHHLPPELTSFVGRSSELAAVGDALAAGRLLTLAGPGGCGKSRLAARASLRQAGRWRDGVWWVDLAPAEDPDGVAPRVAEALGLLLPTGPGAPAALAGQLQDRELLLVLDNCEHVVAGVAGLSSAILGRCPHVALLATSRATIGVPGERVWRVPPMRLSDAVELFLDRAGAHGNQAPDRAGARRVCDRLDRLPLAIELAAGWTGSLSPAQIADSLAEPFTLLDGGPRTAPFRQQTLEGSMRWSHELLDDDERALFRRLGAFQAGFTAAAVQAVCAAAPLDEDRTLKALRGLIDKSLVIADTTGPAARYRMLGVIRSYALAKLEESGESDWAHDRHLDAYLDLAEGLLPLLDTDKDAWRRAIGDEYPNIRAATFWGLSRREPQRGRRLAAATAWLWHLNGRGDEGLPLLQRAAQLGGGEESALQARLQAGVALVADTTGPSAEGYAAAEAAQAMASRTGDAATARLARVLGAIGRFAHDLDAARDQAVLVWDEARQAGDQVVADYAQALVGLVHLVRDEHDQAISLLGPAVDRLLPRHDRGVASSALGWMALASARLGRLARAGDLAEQAVRTARPLRDFHRVGSALSVLAEVRGLQGELGAAERALEPVRRLVDDSGRSPFIPGWERTAAQLALWAGQPAVAVRWCRREAATYTFSGSASDDALTPETQVVLAAALRALGESGQPLALLQRAEQAARALGMPRVLAAAVEQRGHLLGDDDPDAAVGAHHEALRIRRRHGLVLGCIDSLEALAAMALRRGGVELAALLLGAADRARAESGYAAAATTPDPRRELPRLLRRPETADAVARGRGMGIGEAAAYAARARGPRDRPSSGWASLTPTERSVVELAAEGLSNPEIGRRLFIGRGTVKTHLAHVYAKLGVANRTELARLATLERSRQPPG